MSVSFSVGFWAVLEIIFKIIIYAVIIGAVVLVVSLIINLVKDSKAKAKKNEEKSFIIDHAIADLKNYDNKVLLSIYRDITKDFTRMRSNPANKALLAVSNKRPDGSVSAFLDLDNTDYFNYKNAIEN